jgi:SNF2 family DNA or RNA helicase
VEGVQWLLSIVHKHKDSECPGGILADEMGLGKTIQICAFLEQWNREREREIKEWTSNPHRDRIARPQNLAVLLVLPLSLMCQWADELTKWFFFLVSFRFYFYFPPTFE